MHIAHTYTHVHICTYVCTHAYSHTHAHTHSQIRATHPTLGWSVAERSISVGKLLNEVNIMKEQVSQLYTRTGNLPPVCSITTDALYLPRLFQHSHCSLPPLSLRSCLRAPNLRLLRWSMTQCQRVSTLHWLVRLCRD